MKKLLLLLFWTMFLSSCDKTTGEAGGGLPKPYLLNNVTFDSSGNPSLNGWIHGNSDMDSIAHFDRNVPPGSTAKWSLALSPGWLPSTEFVYRNFTGLSSGIYKLTLWGKVIGMRPLGGGSVLISKIQSQPWQPAASAIVSDTVWQQITVLDTLTLGAADTTKIVFTGGSTEVANWTILFNNITFEKIP